MYSKFGAAVALLLLSVSPSFAAGSACEDPIAPTQIDGTKATAKQMKDAIQDFKTFQAASDDYQSCLVDDLKLQKTEAAKGKDPKPLDPSIEQAVNANIDRIGPGLQKGPPRRLTASPFAFARNCAWVLA